MLVYLLPMGLALVYRLQTHKQTVDIQTSLHTLD